MTELLIPDVSDYQGTINWPQVLASGRAGGICKATESTSYVAKTFAANWAALGRLGAVRGAYAFARPGRATPEAQADHFLATVGGWAPTDLLVLDLEDGTGNLDAFALAFLTRVEQRTGIVPWFYSYAPFIRAHIADRRLARFPLWLAAYTSKAPAAPPPWSAWQLWQHTDKAKIPGIGGACDESVGADAALPPVPATSPAQPATAPTVRTQTVPIPVHDFEEAAVKQTMMVIGKLDDQGRGWSDWNPGLGRDPNVLGVTLLGPSPPDDGYWEGQSKVQLSAQPHGGAVRVTVRGGTPGDTISCFVTVS